MTDRQTDGWTDRWTDDPGKNNMSPNLKWGDINIMEFANKVSMLKNAKG